jgi:hypothetical protein
MRLSVFNGELYGCHYDALVTFEGKKMLGIFDDMCIIYGQLCQKCFP